MRADLFGEARMRGKNCRTRDKWSTKSFGRVLKSREGRGYQMLHEVWQRGC